MKISIERWMGRHIDTLQDFKTTIAGRKKWDCPEILLEGEEWEAQFLAWLGQMAQERIKSVYGQMVQERSPKCDNR